MNAMSGITEGEILIVIIKEWVSSGAAGHCSCSDEKYIVEEKRKKKNLFFSYLEKKALTEQG